MPLIRAVRAQQVGAWVIATSARADRALMAGLMGEVPDGFLMKPFSVSEFHALVEHLPRHAEGMFDAVVDARVGREGVTAMQRRLRLRAVGTALSQTGGGVRAASRLLDVDPRYTRALRDEIQRGAATDAGIEIAPGMADTEKSGGGATRSPRRSEHALTA